MRILSLSTGAMLLSSLLASSAFPQGASPSSAASPTAYEYNTYFSAVSDQTGTAPAAPAAAPAAAAAPANPCPEAEAPKADEGWKLPQLCILKENGWTMGGWMDAGITFNGAYPVDGSNGPVEFNDLNDTPQVNQFYMFIKKDVDTKGCGVDYGGRIDAMYGTDGRFPQAAGLETPGNPTYPTASSKFITGASYYYYSEYRFALPQAYADLAYNDLTIRLGHFYTMLGNEQVTAPDNIFYSHTYAFTYGLPFTHTGVLAIYKVNDQLTVTNGVQVGNDAFDYTGGYQRIGYLGEVNWTSKSKKLEVAAGLSATDSQANQGYFTSPATGADNAVTIADFVSKIHLSDDLTYISEGDYGQQSDPTLGIATWYGISQYLQYKLNDKWSAGLRAEWFRDNNGARVTTFEPVANITGLTPYQAEVFKGDFYDITAGLTWKANANLTLRQEIRYDWSRAIGSKGDLPFNAGIRSDQFLTAIDAIYSF